MRSSDTRRQLETALEFEMTQLALLERQMAAALPADAVQRANWPALVASHQKAIAYYRARLAELEDNPG